MHVARQTRAFVVLAAAALLLASSALRLHAHDFTAPQPADVQCEFCLQLGSAAGPSEEPAAPCAPDSGRRVGASGSDAPVVQTRAHPPQLPRAPPRV